MQGVTFVLLTLLFPGLLSQDCPGDWFDAGSLGCYRFLEGQVNLSWVEAQLACERAGGYLAEPQTELQIEFLSELAGLEAGFTGIGYWYIGLTDLGREGDWLWVHNEAQLESDLWSSSSPSNKTHNSDDCAVMVLKNSAVYWEDHSCTAPEVSHRTVAPVCQADTQDSVVTTTTTTTALPTTTSVQCESGWTNFNGSCFKFISSGQYWTTADAYCLQYGAKLASIHSRSENDFLNTLAGSNDYWIGGYPKDNSWVWSDLSEFDYSEYYDVSTGGYCLYQDYGKSGWTSSYCDQSYQKYFICKVQ